MRNLLILGIAACLAACSVTPAAEPVRGGLSENGTVSYLGIEYATAERWQLPKLNESWETPAEFKRFGPACPQKGQAVMVEDCLFLNIFKPEQVVSNAPVLVWIHGGGLIFGEGGDGPKTFADDGIIVVTFNYRLGKLGFHDWAGWGENDPRNFGQADMVAALDWVQANIHRFGGDAENVTLAGHSAGGMGVQLMMVDPRAKGKFARAWSHAGYGAWPFPKAYNPTPEERARIRYGALETDKPAEALVSELEYFHLPFIDAPYLKVQPINFFFDGFAHDVPYVAGANSYDGAGTLQGAGFTPESFLARIDGPEIRAAYADDFAVSDLQAAQRIFGDLRYFRSSMLSVNAKSGYLFLYDEKLNGAPGATHGQQYDRIFASGDFPMKTAMREFIQNGHPGWSSISETNYYKMAVFSPELTEVVETEFRDKMIALATAVKALE